MPGLVPGIRVFLAIQQQGVDGRDIVPAMTELNVDQITMTRVPTFTRL